MSLECRVTRSGGLAHMELQGTLDRDAAAELDAGYQLAIEGDGDTIELDFSAVDYINSSGIAIVVGLLRSARQQGRSVLARGLSPHYQHIFHITRLSDYVTIIDSFQE